MSEAGSGSRRRKTQILIVDDHPVVRHGLISLINAEPDMEVCGETDSAPAALDLVRQLRPTLVIVDIFLNAGSGTELLKQVRHLDSHVKMLVASMHDERVYAERVLRAGAMGFVRKDAPTPILLHAIREVLSGRYYVSEDMKEALLKRLAAIPSAETVQLKELTDRELEIFSMIGRGMTLLAIADRLSLSVKTVETHREHIRTKLGLQSSREVAHRAIHWVQDNL